MSCITVFAAPAAMATRQLAQAELRRLCVVADGNTSRSEALEPELGSWSPTGSGKRRMEARWMEPGQSFAADHFCNMLLTK